MPRNAADLTAQMSVHALTSAEIDMSAFYAEPPGTTLFVYADPGPNDFYRAADEALQFKEELEPTWHPRLCLHVCTLALAHKATYYVTHGKDAAGKPTKVRELVPLDKDGPTRAEIHRQIVKKNAAGFQSHLDKFYLAFPHLLGNKTPDSEKKTGVPEDDAVATDASVLETSGDPSAAA